MAPCQWLSNADVQYKSGSAELFILKGCWTGWGPWQHPAMLWGGKEDALGPGPDALGPGLNGQEFSTLSLYVSAT